MWRHRSLTEASIRFDGVERFSVCRPRDAAEDVRVFSYACGESLPENFFSCEPKGETRGKVEDVSCLVGDNASGKTSIASVFSYLARPVNENTPKYILVYKIGSEYYCRHRQNWRIDTSHLPKEILAHWHEELHEDELRFGFVYYSPIATTEHVLVHCGNLFSDVSTSGLIGRLEGLARDTKRAVMSELSARDTLGILRFLHSRASRHVKDVVGVPMPIPVGAYLRVNRRIDRYREGEPDDWRRHFDDTMFSAYWAKHLSAVNGTEKSLSLTIRFMGTVPWLLLEKFDTSQRSEDVATGLLENVLKTINDLKGFISNHDHAVDVSVLKNVSSFAREFWKSLSSDFLAELKACGIDCGALDKFLACLEEPLTDSALRFSYGSFTADGYGVSTLNQHELDWLCRAISLMADVGFRTSPFEVSFEKMSSGEMAYLSMLGRLYQVVGPGCGEPWEGPVDAIEQEEPKRDLVIYLDEAETAMHPGWQRSLVLVLIWFVENFCKHRVHLVFASHSAIVLSDVPLSHAVRLQQREDNWHETLTDWGADDFRPFGAYLPDLYREAFRQEEGAAGAFATLQINRALCEVGDVVSKRQKTPLSNRSRKILSLVGERTLQLFIMDLKKDALI